MLFSGFLAVHLLKTHRQSRHRLAFPCLQDDGGNVLVVFKSEPPKTINVPRKWKQEAPSVHDSQTIDGAGLFTYYLIPEKSTIHVGRYTSPMDGLGQEIFFNMFFFLGEMFNKLWLGQKVGLLKWAEWTKETPPLSMFDYRKIRV